MKNKYVPKLKERRRQQPESWKSGPDPLKHEKYYAWLKHRSQARYRGEPYDITWEDWEQLWSDEDFLQRGRSRDSLCLGRRNLKQSWSLENCYVGTRAEHLKRSSEFRKDRDG